MTRVVQLGHSGSKRKRALVAPSNPPISSNVDQYRVISSTLDHHSEASQISEQFRPIPSNSDIKKCEIPKSKSRLTARCRVRTVDLTGRTLTKPASTLIPDGLTAQNPQECHPRLFSEPSTRSTLNPQPIWLHQLAPTCTKLRYLQLKKLCAPLFPSIRFATFHPDLSGATGSYRELAGPKKCKNRSGTCSIRDSETALNCTRIRGFCTYVHFRALGCTLVRQNEKI